MGAEIDVAEMEAVMSRSLSFAADNVPLKNNATRELPLLSLNHVSFVCKSVPKSVEFYVKVLGFVLIKRPSSFNFEGAWLFNHGIGIHLLKTENAIKKNEKINPKDNHISFQCTDMNVIIQRLEEMKIEFVTAIVREGGIIVDQLFFHDPDGYMIEICNCQNLPVLPLSSCPIRKMSTPKITIPNPPSLYGGKQQCSAEVEALMIENLAMDMMNISI
ncbi:Lactoylglutathione lyase / glyoxalase I family protein [Perilla frutescens var. hirtella]|uniref:Lactoylglutathione lyase / glyoxalase I family protein n=1 Tax=Perilla frutescens var. hirtella TaxID=608512 RepID=A0AAD4J486_PERFH|nr:Lactoylglutathione lyase / glyoxalase I family protein [Perilla frutescens var. hirtella]KAH6805758.1 Lactoylglutathione lyase / glyoxalase I family protein [Perilla frutescens var. frutescens]KAH6826365.1 Lactoylglutathione lyase / glyoxalase I family protein [Perilla frutescens var. hirtella]